MAKNSFFEKDHGWDSLVTSFHSAPGETVAFVGFLRSSGSYIPKAKRGKVAKGESITMAQLGAIHEFGSKDGTIPERSFMRSSIDSNSRKIEALLNKLINLCMARKMSTKQALGIVAEFVKSAMKNKIVSGVPPANTQETIDRKKSSTPLIDTGQLLNSIDWEIKEHE